MNLSLIVFHLFRAPAGRTNEREFVDHLFNLPIDDLGNEFFIAVWSRASITFLFMLLDADQTEQVVAIAVAALCRLHMINNALA